jgi:hypothetical protein
VKRVVRGWYRPAVHPGNKLPPLGSFKVNLCGKIQLKLLCQCCQSSSSKIFTIKIFIKKKKIDNYYDYNYQANGAGVMWHNITPQNPHSARP